MMAPHLAPIGTGYIALTVLVINVVAAVVLTVAGRCTRVAVPVTTMPPKTI